MDVAYYGNTVSSPLVLSALGGDHTLLQKTLDAAGHLCRVCSAGLRRRSTHHGPAGAQNHPGARLRNDGRDVCALALIPNIEKMVIPFLCIYGLSFFFTEFGPNATTFVYPSEIFPVRVRTTGHGIAAAMGKLGGFLGVFLFPYLMAWKGLLGAESAAAIASVCGLVLTIFTLPETKGKSLEELSTERSTPAERAAA